MKDLKDFLIYLLRRDSVNAGVVAIAVAQDMSPKDLRGLADYYIGLADDKESQGDCISVNYI